MAGPDRARRPQVAGVSDPPKPAPNLHFAGQMKDGAFEGKQFLVERDGQFIQLSELLLLTLAHVDGKRSIEQIAKGTSATSAGRSCLSILFTTIATQPICCTNS